MRFLQQEILDFLGFVEICVTYAIIVYKRKNLTISFDIFELLNELLLEISPIVLDFPLQVLGF